MADLLYRTGTDKLRNGELAIDPTTGKVYRGGNSAQGGRPVADDPAAVSLTRRFPAVSAKQMFLSTAPADITVTTPATNAGNVVISQTIGGSSKTIATLAADKSARVVQAPGQPLSVTASVGDTAAFYGAADCLGQLDQDSTTASRATKFFAPSSGTVNFGHSSDPGADVFLTIVGKNQSSRISRNGVLSSVKLWIGTSYTTGKISEVWVQVFRGTLTAATLVGEFQIGTMTAGAIKTHAVASPFAVQSGDYLVLLLKYGGETGTPWHLASGASNSIAFKKLAAKPVDGADISTGYALAAVLVSVEAIVTGGPAISLAGDSIAVGHPSHYGYWEDSLTVSAPSDLAALLEAATGYQVEGVGVGSRTTTTIASSFAADVVAHAPKITIINGGVNDISGGSISKATFLANWTAMLDASAAAGIYVVACKIFPWTAGTPAQMTTRDEWNAALATLVAGYSNAIIYDGDADLGQYASDGPNGNLWDIKTAYNADNVHFNAAGYAALATAIAGKIRELIVAKELFA